MQTMEVEAVEVFPLWSLQQLLNKATYYKSKKDTNNKMRITCKVKEEGLVLMALLITDIGVVVSLLFVYDNLCMFLYLIQ